MKKSVLIIVAIIVLGGGVAAVMMMQKNKDSNKSNSSNSSKSESDMNMDSNTGDSTPIATDKVTIDNFAFTPASITVKKGTTVTWTNNDTTPHTVTADGDGGMDSGTINKGGTYTFTFDTAGTFAYHCSFHSNMTGTVTVTE